MPSHPNSFDSRSTLDVNGRELTIYRLDALEKAGIGDVSTLPFCLKVLLENLLRCEDGKTVEADDVRSLAGWDPTQAPSHEIAFRPARVLLQDFTGVPAVVDLAAMRESFARLGGDPSRINPLLPADLVIDHSLQVDHFGTPEAFEKNVALEMERNKERYQLLRWGQGAFEGFGVVPPGMGIVHQVNLEYLGHVVFVRDDGDGAFTAYPDSLVGTDSHTTMINGLGVLGWGVGGIEAEAGMLGQPISMLIPNVVGFKLDGALPEGATATDLVLTVVERLREKGVVGKFVEFYGPGLATLSLPDRATIANMAPEYGATCGIFPIDEKTLDYLRLTGRSEEQVAAVEAYSRAQGLFHTADSPDPRFSDTVCLDMADVVPCISGPKRPQDRIPLTIAKSSWRKTLPTLIGEDATADPAAVQAWTEDLNAASSAALGRIDRSVAVEHASGNFDLRQGAVAIAAITSCTNTSNPTVMVAAGLVARKARERGLTTAPWVKTSLAPGSQVVTNYLDTANLSADLESLGFHTVGYGCTSCIGNSGPLPTHVADAVREGDLVMTSVLSGNRNFEGRISPMVKANYLASPPLVVAYAIAGRLDWDPTTEAMGQDPSGEDVFLKDVWPSPQEVNETLASCLTTDMFRETYASIEGSPEWRNLPTPSGGTFGWDEDSTYVREPPFFDGLSLDVEAPGDIVGARVLLKLGDSVTTDHISPAGSIPADGPAGEYLKSKGVDPKDFNSFGARRGNHEVMMRGTFANIRLRNQLAPGTEGCWTQLQPSGEQMSVYDASVKYREAGVPTIVLAGTEYGTGSSRDWAAKGPMLLGVRAVIVNSFERIHRSNLIGMGILPLEYMGSDSAESLGLTGGESFSITGISALEPRGEVKVTAEGGSAPVSFSARVRIDTPQELEYYQHGGILQYVLRQLATASS